MPAPFFKTQHDDFSALRYFANRIESLPNGWMDGTLAFLSLGSRRSELENWPNGCMKVEWLVLIFGFCVGVVFDLSLLVKK